MEGTNLIDDILEESTPTTHEGQVTENQDTPPAAPEGDPEKPAESAPEAPVEKTDAEKLADALAQVDTLTQERDTALADANSLKTEKDALETTVAENSAEITLLKEERDTFRNKNIALAKTAHKFLAERAVDLRIALGEHQKEERETLISEYAKTPAKVLESTIKDLLDKPTVAVKPRESAPVVSPAAVITDSKHSVEDEAGDITESTNQREKPAELTIQDLADRLEKVLTKNF